MSSKAKNAPEAGAATPKPKKRLGRLLILLVGTIVLGGGGVGAALYASGWLDAGGEDANHPHLVPREDATSEQVAAATARAHGGHVDPRVFKATYHNMEQNFTSNLRGGDNFVQIGIGVSTYYDERVIEHLTEHQMAIRSAILMTLAQQDPLVLATPEGKEALRQALKNAVNGVLTSKEGFGGIDEVFFTSFVTQ